MIRRPPRSTQSRSSAASDVYKRQVHHLTEAYRSRPRPSSTPGAKASTNGSYYLDQKNFFATLQFSRLAPACRHVAGATLSARPVRLGPAGSTDEVSGGLRVVEEAAEHDHERGNEADERARIGAEAVSYTHLTLP